MHTRRTLLAVLIVLVLMARAAAAQDHEAEGLHPFHAAFLLGKTHTGERDGLTFGGDVEFRFSWALGIGATVEHVDEPFRENVWIVPVLVHPTAGLKLTIGGGFERAAEEPEARIGKHGLVRLGAGYDIPLTHGWTLDPDVAVDFVAGERLAVYTLAVGKEFGHSRR